MIGENSFSTERRLIGLNGVSVGPEQDWTETSASWMGSGRSDSFAIAAKILLRKQRIWFWMGSSKSDSFMTVAKFRVRRQRSIVDEAVDGSKNID